MRWVIKFGIYVVIGAVAFLNLQPWLSVGHWLAETGLEIPFENALLNVWGVRNVVEFVIYNSASILALVFWGVCQTLQVMALMAESPNVLNGFAWIFRGFPLSQWVVTNAEIIGRLGWGAYALEALVCFLIYPPYGVGMEDFLMDLWAWDSDLWNWPQIVLILLTILMFEGAVWFSCFLAGAILPATQRRVEPS